MVYILLGIMEASRDHMAMVRPSFVFLDYPCGSPTLRMCRTFLLACPSIYWRH